MAKEKQSDVTGVTKMEKERQDHQLNILCHLQQKAKHSLTSFAIFSKRLNTLKRFLMNQGTQSTNYTDAWHYDMQFKGDSILEQSL